jgi:hypothetical protein
MPYFCVPAIPPAPSWRDYIEASHAISAIALALLAFPLKGTSQATTNQPIKNIVLVRGAWGVTTRFVIALIASLGGGVGKRWLFSISSCPRRATHD